MTKFCWWKALKIRWVSNVDYFTIRWVSNVDYFTIRWVSNVDYFQIRWVSNVDYFQIRWVSNVDYFQIRWVSNVDYFQIWWVSNVDYFQIRWVSNVDYFLGITWRVEYHRIISTLILLKLLILTFLLKSDLNDMWMQWRRYHRDHHIRTGQITIWKVSFKHLWGVGMMNEDFWLNLMWCIWSLYRDICVLSFLSSSPPFPTNTCTGSIIPLPLLASIAFSA